MDLDPQSMLSTAISQPRPCSEIRGNSLAVSRTCIQSFLLLIVYRRIWDNHLGYLTLRCRTVSWGHFSPASSAWARLCLSSVWKVTEITVWDNCIPEGGFKWADGRKSLLRACVTQEGPSKKMERRWAEVNNRQEEEMPRGLSVRADLEDWRRSGLAWNQSEKERGDIIRPISAFSLHEGDLACGRGTCYCCPLVFPPVQAVPQWASRNCPALLSGFSLHRKRTAFRANESEDMTTPRHGWEDFLP